MNTKTMGILNHSNEGYTKSGRLTGEDMYEYQLK